MKINNYKKKTIICLDDINITKALTYQRNPPNLLDHQYYFRQTRGGADKICRTSPFYPPYCCTITIKIYL